MKSKFNKPLTKFLFLLQLLSSQVLWAQEIEPNLANSASEEKEEPQISRVHVGLVAMTWDRIGIYGLNLGIPIFDQLSVGLAAGTGEYSNIDVFIRQRYLYRINFVWRQLYLRYDLMTPAGLDGIGFMNGQIERIGIGFVGGVEDRKGEVTFGPHSGRGQQKVAYQDYGRLLGIRFFIRPPSKQFPNMEYGVGAMARSFNKRDFDYTDWQGKEASYGFPQSMYNSVFVYAEYMF